MDFDATTAVRQLSVLPPDPPKPRERSAWGWVPRIVGSATASVLGSIADTAKAYGAAAAQTLEADPMAQLAVGRDRARAGAEEGRRQIAEGEEFISGAGESFRNVRRDLRPDPATASTAERLVFGVAEPLLTLVGGAVTAGPAGILAAGAQQGMQQADDLREQGVDRATRTKVGGLTAVATAAGAALPMAGSTLARTAGLYLVGGPGAYVAQQAASREILRRADYAAVAEQFDPTDPLGLAISALVPLPFAAFGAVRNLRAMRPPDAPAGPAVPTDAVDAAMTHNLTTLADAQEVRALEPPDLPEAPPRPAMPAVEAPPPTELSALMASDDADVRAVARGLAQAAPGIDRMEAAGGAPRAADMMAAMNRAAQEFAARRAGTTTPMPPEVENLIAGIAENARSPARVAEMARQVFESQGDPVDATASVVDRMRSLTDEQLQGTPQEAGKVEPLMRSVAERVKAIEESMPDMPIRTEDGRTVTVADEMARVRREAAEGTDDELGTLDAELVNVAANCALATGSA